MFDVGPGHGVAGISYAAELSGCDFVDTRQLLPRLPSFGYE
jgi:hypothetical protein